MVQQMMSVEPYPKARFTFQAVPTRTSKAATAQQILTFGATDLSIDSTLFVFTNQKVTLNKNGDIIMTESFVVVNKADIGNDTLIVNANDQIQGDSVASLDGDTVEKSRGKRFKFVHTTYLELEPDEIAALKMLDQSPKAKAIFNTPTDKTQSIIEKNAENVIEVRKNDIEASNREAAEEAQEKIDSAKAALNTPPAGGALRKTKNKHRKSKKKGATTRRRRS